MKILEPGKAYHQNDGIGSTLLKKIHKKTVLHALSETVTVTDAMNLGSAVHCAIFEPEKYAKEFVVAPECDRRTKEGKEIWAAFLATSGDKTVLTDDQAILINGMKSAVLNHPIAKNMVSGGEAEYSYYYEADGLKLKCRPDYHKAGALIDLKTTSDASFEGFSRQVGDLGYHLQGAYYLDVFNGSQGTDYKEFYFIAVENKFPHAVAVYRLDETHLEVGRRNYKSALIRLAAYKEDPSEEKELSDYGYPLEIRDVQVPFYILDKINN